MHRHLRSLTIAALSAGLALAAGCGDDDGDGAATISQGDLEDQLTSQIVEADMVTGTPTVTCPGDLTVEVGETMECTGTVEELPGEETPIMVEVLTEDGELDVTIG
jgi:hypothetical protein